MSSTRADSNLVGFSHHPDNHRIAPLLDKYPRQSGPLFHAYVDLVHSARWTNMVVVDLAPIAGSNPQKQSADGSNRGCGWGALIGRRPQGSQLEVVVPCHVSDMLSVAFFDEIFQVLANHSYAVIQPPAQASEGTQTLSAASLQDFDTSHILLAILSPDSTVVYYKLAQGLVKPVN